MAIAESWESQFGRRNYFDSPPSATSGTDTPPLIGMPAARGKQLRCFNIALADLIDGWATASSLVYPATTPGRSVLLMIPGEFQLGLAARATDEVSLLSMCPPDLLTPVAGEWESRRHGFEPDLHFITWHCRKTALRR